MSNDVFAFTGDLTIYHVQTVRDQLRDAWAQGVRCFDTSQLTRLDGAGAQLLASLAKTAQQHQQAITWQGWPSDIEEVVQLLGLAPLLLDIPR